MDAPTDQTNQSQTKPIKGLRTFARDLESKRLGEKARPVAKTTPAPDTKAKSKTPKDEPHRPPAWVTNPLPKSIPQKEPQPLPPVPKFEGLPNLPKTDQAPNSLTTDEADIEIDNDYAAATIIRDTKTNRFKLFPAIRASIKNWVEKIKADQRQKRKPKYSVPDSTHRKGVIQKAASKTGKETIFDAPKIQDRIREREAKAKPKEQPHTFWSPFTNAMYDLLGAGETKPTPKPTIEVTRFNEPKPPAETPKVGYEAAFHTPLPPPVPPPIEKTLPLPTPTPTKTPAVAHLPNNDSTRPTHSPVQTTPKPTDTKPILKWDSERNDFSTPTDKPTSSTPAKTSIRTLATDQEHAHAAPRTMLVNTKPAVPTPPQKEPVRSEPTSRIYAAPKARPTVSPTPTESPLHPDINLPTTPPAPETPTAAKPLTVPIPPAKKPEVVTVAAPIPQSSPLPKERLPIPNTPPIYEPDPTPLLMTSEQSVATPITAKESSLKAKLFAVSTNRLAGAVVGFIILAAGVVVLVQSIQKLAMPWQTLTVRDAPNTTPIERIRVDGGLASNWSGAIVTSVSESGFPLQKIRIDLPDRDGRYRAATPLETIRGLGLAPSASLVVSLATIEFLAINQRPGILMVSNNSNNLRGGLLDWENTLPTELRTLLNINLTANSSFRDGRVENYDVRILRNQSSGEELMVYGIINRNTVIFTQNRLDFLTAANEFAQP